MVSESMRASSLFPGLTASEEVFLRASGVDPGQLHGGKTTGRAKLYMCIHIHTYLSIHIYIYIYIYNRIGRRVSPRANTEPGRGPHPTRTRNKESSVVYGVQLCVREGRGCVKRELLLLQHKHSNARSPRASSQPERGPHRTVTRNTC